MLELLVEVRNALEMALDYYSLGYKEFERKYPVRAPEGVDGPCWISLVRQVAENVSSKVYELEMEKYDNQSFVKSVQEIAYYKWLEEGCPHGRDKEHWKAAELELKQKIDNFLEDMQVELGRTKTERRIAAKKSVTK